MRRIILLFFVAFGQILSLPVKQTTTKPPASDPAELQVSVPSYKHDQFVYNFCKLNFTAQPRIRTIFEGSCRSPRKRSRISYKIK